MNELKQTMAAELKKNGFNSRMVSVSHRECGYSDSYTVKIKNETISMKQIKSILDKYSVSRYDINGEPLMGCNVYIDYERTVYPSTPKELIETVAKVQKMEKGSGLVWKNISICNDLYNNDIDLWNNATNHHIGFVFGYGRSAESIAADIYKCVIDEE